MWGEPCRRVPARGRERCDLHDDDGTRCEWKGCDKQPLLGGRFCLTHGREHARKTPQQAARDALFVANFAALRFLREAIEANDRALALKAAMHVTRLCNAQRIEVEHTHRDGPPAWLRWLPLERRAQLAEWINEARAAMARGDAPVVVSARAIAEARERDDAPVVIDVEATPVDARAHKASLTTRAITGAGDVVDAPEPTPPTPPTPAPKRPAFRSLWPEAPEPGDAPPAPPAPPGEANDAGHVLDVDDERTRL